MDDRLIHTDLNVLSYCHTGARESLTQCVEGGVGQGPRAQSSSVENCLLCLGSWLQPPSMPHTSPLPPFSTLPLSPWLVHMLRISG